jgi:ribulose-phosphate 3-epimerase
MIQIIPAILTNDIAEIKSLVDRSEQASYAEGLGLSKIQIDVIDGVFVENKTVDPANITGIETDLGLDFHLMVKEPVHWIEKSINAGADRIIGQIEMMSSQAEFVDKVQETGLYVGLGVDLETPISSLNPEMISVVDVILLMAVKAGWGGQKFDSRVLDKIRDLSEIRSRERAAFKICVDGGETEEVIDDTHYAGADEVAIGRRLFKGDLVENIKAFQDAAHKIE